MPPILSMANERDRGPVMCCSPIKVQKKNIKQYFYFYGCEARSKGKQEQNNTFNTLLPKSNTEGERLKRYNLASDATGTK